MRHKLSYFFLCCLFVFGLGQPFAQSVESDDSGESLQKKKRTSILLPVASLTPETSWALGLGWLKFYSLKKDSTDKITYPSYTTLKGIYTLKNQYDIEWQTVAFTPKNRYQIEEVLEFIYMPLPFYGVGNDIDVDHFEYYEASMFIQNAKITRRIDSIWFVGLMQQFKSFNMRDVVHDGILDQGIQGNVGGITSGLGLLVRKDTRDNFNSAYTGRYLSVEWLKYHRFIGSDFAFDHYLLDYRYYKSIRKRGRHYVLATQFRTELNIGQVPFYKMAQLGGELNMRGYFKGQFRDHHFTSAQVELRRIYNPYISSVLFVSTGNIYSKMGSYDLLDQKYSFGAGLRLVPPDSKRLSVRIDLAYGNQCNWYVTIGEAF